MCDVIFPDITELFPNLERSSDETEGVASAEKGMKK